MVALLRPLNQQLAVLEAQLARGVAGNVAVRRLCTVPGVGPVTAAAVVATLDNVQRFASAGQVAAYIGLVPRERSSGEQQRRGPLTKAGNRRVRWLLVQAAWAYWRSRATAGTALRAWVERLAGGAGGRRAGAAACADSLRGVARWERVRARPHRLHGIGVAGPAGGREAHGEPKRTGRRRDVRAGAE